MSNHNYSQYSNKKHKQHNKPKVEVEDFVTTAAAPIEPAEVKMEESVETVVLNKPVTGNVTGCSKLNVRAKPTIDADVLAILNGDSEIEIDPSRSTNEWLKITTAAGVEGYCMRKFVNTKL